MHFRVHEAYRYRHCATLAIPVVRSEVSTAANDAHRRRWVALSSIKSKLSSPTADGSHSCAHAISANSGSPQLEPSCSCSWDSVDRRAPTGSPSRAPDSVETHGPILRRDTIMHAMEMRSQHGMRDAT